MKNYRSFETERLIIQPTSIEDADFIFELLRSPKWIQFIGDKKFQNIKDAENYIKNRMISQLERLGYSNYTVIRKSDKVKIGTVGLYDREGLDGIDIGYGFLPDFEKQGYATEATMELLKAAKEVFDISQLQAITMEENIGSVNLLKKLNFKFQKRMFLPDDPEELMLFTKSL